MQLKSREIKIVWTSLQVGQLVDIDREFANWSNSANSSLGKDSFGRRRNRKVKVFVREFTSILDLVSITIPRRLLLTNLHSSLEFFTVWILLSLVTRDKKMRIIENLA